MAVYKVPQDVEADDKLLGPFSFRQFIYLIIVAMAIGIGFFLSRIFIGLALIPAPIVIFFGALALPIKKDQPMEAYLAAMISFYFIKPRKRFWQPDGLMSLVEITAPKETEPERVKDITGEEARARLDYLTDIVDTRGWAVRGLGVATTGIAQAVPSSNTFASDPELYQEAMSAPDMLDDYSNRATRFDTMIDQRNVQSHQQLLSNFQAHATQPGVQQVPQFNPYGTIKQTVIQPATTLDQKTPVTEPSAPYPQQPAPVSTPQPSVPMTQQSTSVKPPSNDIIKLANDSDGMTVAAVAKQAHRIEEKQQKHGLPDEEVEISLH